MEHEHLTQKEYPVSERPYEKAQSQGIEALSDGELLAVILRTGTRHQTALELARRVLNLDEKKHPGLLILRQATAEELRQIDGIGTVKAIQLLAIGELARRMSKTARPELPVMRSAQDIARYYMEDFRHLGYEQLLLGMLDHKGRLIGESIMSRGKVNATFVSVRELFLTALRRGAVQIFLVHNHPSGDPAPSDEDIAMTRRAAEAGRILDIPLADHLIIGDLRYTSLRDVMNFSEDI
ncbi:MAG: DNA repair protein RadC [Lachnospiraceae bacterium]|nr:DNA repair protein RadC [Lachnospiraceae bacterium]MBQ9561863.1 DNA repair protein RadC [Lachnospiraceae bacterium]MBQ9592501.1 DNA repair protein RadC [Lachnospiraceae bacterium]MBR0153646.1 DNA repair protein RadC [Lachnospiraceae bacterium]